MNEIDPVRDVKIIEAELKAKDIQNLENLRKGKKANKVLHSKSP